VRLSTLAVADWRNLAQARLEGLERFVVLHGDNGQGKTNLLEAVHVLATLKSFRERRPGNLIRHGADEARIVGQVEGSSGTRRLDWRVSKASRHVVRELKLDGHAPEGLQAWFHQIRAILYCPDHNSIVRGEPDLRRKMVDRAAFTARPGHLDVVRAYQRVVDQKAALLRAGRSVAELEVWDEQLAELGARLAVRRVELVDEVRAPFQAMVQAISGGGPHEEVDLAIKGIGFDAHDEAEVAERIRARIHELRSEEVRRGRVLTGPHRDDLDIFIDGRSARNFASQGQARTLVLSLKLAELVAARARGQAPLFLLDDLTSELDAGRMGRLVDVLADQESQVWITTTDPVHLGPLPTGELSTFKVCEGRV
jgi:DNA replication and repair protein RecF